jgi:hypothetical protein
LNDLPIDEGVVDETRVRIRRHNALVILGVLFVVAAALAAWRVSLLLAGLLFLGAMVSFVLAAVGYICPRCGGALGERHASLGRQYCAHCGARTRN